MTFIFGAFVAVDIIFFLILFVMLSEMHTTQAQLILITSDLAQLLEEVAKLTSGTQPAEKLIFKLGTAVNQ